MPITMRRPRLVAQATFVRFMADQAGMTAVNRAVEALADDPAPPGAFVRGERLNQLLLVGRVGLEPTTGGL
ncbi:MAG TPA: hypothetical protein VKU77_08920 [Streptosporangiaceae bacterium]|nr:hypothetical protein [Streptosporangiaceae bacterium]